MNKTQKNKNWIVRISAFTFYLLYAFCKPISIIISIVGIICASITILGMLLTDDVFPISVSSKENFTIRSELKKICKELILFVLILFIGILVDCFFSTSTPSNQSAIIELFAQYPIRIAFLAIILAPIYEEFIYRFLPFPLLRNHKVIYVIVTSIVFAGVHVIHDPNPIHQLFSSYLVNSAYYGYRYAKTEDIRVTISLHSFNNFLGILSLLI